MKKLFLTLVIALSAICVFAQNNQDTSRKNQPPQQQFQPNMEKDTIVLFLGRFGGPVKADEVLKGDSLMVNKPGFMIVGFKMVYPGDTSAVVLEAKNYRLTPDMKAALKKLKPGQPFAFVNIMLGAADGKVHRPTMDRIEMFIEKQQ